MKMCICMFGQTSKALQSPAPDRVLPSPVRDGNEGKFIETGFGEDGWVNS